MSHSALFLVLGASGGTGKHFVSQVLADGHRVRALVRSPEKLAKLVGDNQRLEVWPGSITDETIDTDKLVTGVDYVVSMLGDVNAQRSAKINTAFVKRLVPSMRRHGGQLSPLLWGIRYTLARGYAGQHEDNEAVMEYLATEGNDLEWIVHRAGIGSDGASKGVLERSKSFSVATFVDCATYSYRLIMDDSAVPLHVVQRQVRTQCRTAAVYSGRPSSQPSVAVMLMFGGLAFHLAAPPTTRGDRLSWNSVSSEVEEQAVRDLSAFGSSRS
ncbi:hypothetical protein LTR12_005089 [Friedmanniomyces endolithicus]|nr:hypothetical protein LTR12_005089 [Friedmanniomyces endolithicus]